MALESLVHVQQEILDIAARHGARNIRVFGSVARGDNRSDSDAICWWMLNPAEHF